MIWIENMIIICREVSESLRFLIYVVNMLDFLCFCVFYKK